MTESTKVPPKTDPKDPPDDKDTKDEFKIVVEGLEGVSKEQQEAIQAQFKALTEENTKTIEALTNQISTLQKSVDASGKKADDVVKESLLAKLKKGGLDPEGFKTLDVKALETVVKGMAKTNEGIQLNEPKGSTDPSKKGDTITVWDPIKKKRVPFY